MKPKLLCILHCSPPVHGASKVGDFISKSKKLDKEFDCKFITIKSSDTIEDIGKISLKKIYLIVQLYIKVLITLIIFRPDKIYFTASIHSVAFYRDLLLSTLWKCYKLFKYTDVYYHYHTKGVDKFISSSRYNFKLTNFFIKDVHIVLLSPLLKDDFRKVSGYKDILFLPNGVENSYNNKIFEKYILDKKITTINILYLSNMIKSKGYFEVMKLANTYKDKNYHFHFAGGWQNREDEKDFFTFIKNNRLEKIIHFHGFVNGVEKKRLFEEANIFIFPTKYENEAFPLSLLEALSYGLPIISTDEGSIPCIIDDKSGIVIRDLKNLEKALNDAINRLVNIETAKYCRKRYLDKFSLKQFEKNLIRIFK
jgi:glycosyltransferase involved in cell wall biosynthesis